MILEQLVQGVEDRLYQLGRRLGNADPLADLRAEADLLSRELQERHALMERKRAEREAVSRRLNEQEGCAARLISHIETYLHIGDPSRAWDHALQLEQVRQTLHQDRVRLRMQEASYHRHQAHVKQLEGRLAGLLEKLYP